MAWEEKNKKQKPETIKTASTWVLKEALSVDCCNKQFTFNNDF